MLQRQTPLGWWFGFGLSGMLLLFIVSIAYILARGIGVWGVNIPVAWGFAITNFIWWIGIGHAGTLIAAMLLLMHQQWRSSINRFAEAMTLFALGCASLFPVLHLGRPWFLYWLLPYPNIMRLWPQFKSPLVWDVGAILTYGVVSLLFWHIGLRPDLATLRDRAQSRLGWVVYGILAMGWRGTSRQWYHYERLYLLLAGLATALVVSVHSIVSLDFAFTIVPGWHSTIFPPYFVAGAAFSGLAVLIMITILLRAAFQLEDFITMRHFENMAKLLLATGLIVSYSYIVEIFFAWYGRDQYAAYIMGNRARGAYALMFWTQILCNVITPQALWCKRVRSSLPWLFIIALIVTIGMWVERHVIVITSLHRDYLPSAWGIYAATLWDWAALIGSCGLFLNLLFLCVRFLPVISMTAMRQLLPQAKVQENEA